MSEMVEEYEVKSTLVKRITVRHRVFAGSKAQAEALVKSGKGERVDRQEKLLEKPSFSAKKVRT